MLHYKFIALFIVIFSSCVNAQNCNRLPSQLKKLVTPGNILLFGEMHGTEEMPEKFFDVVCVASESQKQVNIGIEAPLDLTNDIRNFINTSNDIALDSELLKHTFWSGDPQGV